MAVTGSKPRTAVQLDWRDEDGFVTVTPSDQSRFAIKIRRAVELLQVGADLDDFKAQFQVLLSVLASWLKNRTDIADAYITTSDGTLAFLVVRNIAAYDEEFEDSLSELDMDVANDVDLDKVRIRAISLPSVSDEALASFLTQHSHFDTQMPRHLNHIALANKNHDALMFLVREHANFPEWITTIAFYKAVQIVEAVCVEIRGRGCNGHESRLRILELPPFNKTSIFKHHRSLWNESTIARYLSDRDSHATYATYADRIPPNDIVEKIIRRRLVPLEDAAIGLMGDESKKLLRRIHPPSLP